MRRAPASLAALTLVTPVMDLDERDEHHQREADEETKWGDGKPTNGAGTRR
jgi:hypothetical protein